jgi:hypothetical protein
MIDRILAWSPQKLRWLVIGFIVFFWGIFCFVGFNLSRWMGWR